MVTAAAPVRHTDVFPQVDLEGLYVRIRRRRAGVALRGRAGGRLLNLRRGRAAGRTGGEPERQCERCDELSGRGRLQRRV